VAHIELTPRCDRSCRYCYHPGGAREMSTAQLESVTTDLAAAGVLQVTFGGGEPFLRGDVFRLARHARSLGLGVCATTNGDRLADFCRAAGARAAGEELRPFARSTSATTATGASSRTSTGSPRPACRPASGPA